MKSTLLFASVGAMALAAAFATPAFAQEEPAAVPSSAPTAEECAANPELTGCASADGGDAEQGTIIVTGSRIARPTLDSIVPVTSVGPEDILDQGDISIGDALNDLPSLRSTFSQGNSTRFIGTAGLNLLDLRGLGIERTLVLVNGKRHITALPGDYIVDVNTIPADLIERIDIVTGGNSAIYGSDAVAGVVNFILKRDYEGIRVRAQGGVSDKGDRGTYFVSLTAGENFGDGRGNVAVALEYGKAEPLYFRQRDGLTGASSGRNQFQVVEPTTGEPFGTDGIPDRTFQRRIRNGSISNGGTLGTVLGGTAALRFDSRGNIVTDVPEQSFIAFGSGNFQGSNQTDSTAQGATLRDTGQLFAGVERFSANLLAHYDVSDAFRPFIEAKAVRVKAIQEGQPSFLQGTLNGFLFGFNAGIQELRCGNPFLSAQNRAVLLGGSGNTPGSVAARCAAFTPAVAAVPATPTTPAQPAIPAAFILGPNGERTFAPDNTLTLARFNTDFGGRGEFQDRDTYRVVVGVDGTFNDDWRYEVAFNYGRFESDLRSTNNLVIADVDGNLDGFSLAIDAVTAPAAFSGSNFVLGADGQRVICGINAGAAGNVRPDCVPINIFGANRADPRALDFINTTSQRVEEAEEYVASAFISGDLSQLFELPGGPIGFAIGAEYRRETAFSEYDELVAAGGTFLNAIPPFDPPSFEVKEAFGEIRVPILRDVDFFQELTFEAAGRVSDYKGAVGTVYAYNLGGTWAPVDDIRFRGNYSTSVRAPTQSDLFSTPSENFAQLNDPCDSANINANPNRAANCAAAGVPATVNAALQAACVGSPSQDIAQVGRPFVNCLARAFTTGFLSGGNPTLVEEEGKSYTIGAVITPRFLPGFSLTVDYYNIEIENQIATLAAQTIINLCYDNANGVNNQFCATVQRDPATGLFVEPAVISGGVNFASSSTEGIDVDLAYRRTFDNGHRLSLRAIGTYLIARDDFVDPNNPRDPNRIKSELGDPEFAANLNLNYDFGRLDLSYNLRFIDKTIVNAEAYELFFPNTGVCPSTGVVGFSGGTCTPGTITTLDPSNIDAYDRPFNPRVFYHSIRAEYEVDTKFSFYGGVDNLFDRKPPLGLLGVEAGSPYDAVGRFIYFGATARF